MFSALLSCLPCHGWMLFPGHGSPSYTPSNLGQMELVVKQLCPCRDVFFFFLFHIEAVSCHVGFFKRTRPSFTRGPGCLPSRGDTSADRGVFVNSSFVSVHPWPAALLGGSVKCTGLSEKLIMVQDREPDKAFFSPADGFRLWVSTKEPQEITECLLIQLP